MKDLEQAIYFNHLPSYEDVHRAVLNYLNLYLDLELNLPHLTSLADKRGIYQYWNREYVACLANTIKEWGITDILEVAAGDGMLSHYLRQQGINIRATDSLTWIQPRNEVEKLDVVQAIRKYQPKLVIASWLPFETRLDFDIFNEKPTYIILIGEPFGEACGHPDFWASKHWKKMGYSMTILDCDRWNLCRTDITLGDDEIMKHSATILFFRV